MKEISLIKKISKWTPFIYSGVLTLLGILFWAISKYTLGASISSGLIEYIIGFGILSALVFKGHYIINCLVNKSGWTFIGLIIISVVIIIFKFPVCDEKLLREYFSGLCIIIVPILLYKMKNTGYYGMIFSTMIIFALAFITYKTSGIFSALALVLISMALICYCEHKEWFGEKSLFYSVIFWLALLLSSTILVLNILCYDMVLMTLLYRIEVFFKPETYFTIESYIYTLIRSLINESVLFGQGGRAEGFGLEYGHPYFSYYYLAYFSNLFGFWILIAVTLLFVGFFYICFKKIRKLPFLGKLFSVSILLYIIAETILFLMSNIGYGIFINTSLPFVSEYNLWINMILVGFLLAILNMKPEFKDIEQKSSFDCDFITKKWILLMERVTGTELIDDHYDDDFD